MEEGIKKFRFLLEWFSKGMLNWITDGLRLVKEWNGKILPTVHGQLQYFQFNFILCSTKLLLQTISHFTFLHQIFILGSLLYIFNKIQGLGLAAANWDRLETSGVHRQVWNPGYPIVWALSTPAGSSVRNLCVSQTQLVVSDKVVLTTYSVLINIKKRQMVIFWFLQRFVIW